MLKVINNLPWVIEEPDFQQVNKIMAEHGDIYCQPKLIVEGGHHWYSLIRRKK